MRSLPFPPTRVVILTAIALGMLGLWGMVAAQQKGDAVGQPPFANAVDQRQEMIRELQAIRELVKEQTALLRQLVEKDDEGGKRK